MADFFTFSWRIENFSMCQQKTKDYIKSPAFKIECLNNVEGNLCVYPKGRITSKQITCSLIIPEGQYTESRVKLMIISKEDSRKNKSSSFTIKEIALPDIFVTATRDDIYKEEGLFLPKDTLTLECQIKNKNSVSLSPEFCFGRTLIQLERHVLNIPLAFNLFNDQSGWRITHDYSITLAFQRLLARRSVEFKFYFRVNNRSNRDNDVEIRKLSHCHEPLFLICKVIFHSGSELNRMFRSEHLFRGNSGSSSWKFPLTINSDEMKSLQSSSASLKFEISFSEGSLISEIDTNQEIQCQTRIPKAVGKAWKILNNIYNTKKFSDITLKVGSAQYRAHKFVLSATSPVFEAMFASDMTEVEKGIVIINDIDASTFEKMLLFLYTGTIENLEMDSAAKLYSAADKYLIMELKQECTSYLNANLGNENICEVLEKADLHQDRELEIVARNYIYSHQREVFNSESWKNFMGRQIHLAADVMHQVCKKK